MENLFEFIVQQRGLQPGTEDYELLKQQLAKVGALELKVAAPKTARAKKVMARSVVQRYAEDYPEHKPLLAIALQLELLARQGVTHGFSYDQSSPIHAFMAQFLQDFDSLNETTLAIIIKDLMKKSRKPREITSKSLTSGPQRQPETNGEVATPSSKTLLSPLASSGLTS